MQRQGRREARRRFCKALSLAIVFYILFCTFAQSIYQLVRRRHGSWVSVSFVFDLYGFFGWEGINWWLISGGLGEGTSVGWRRQYRRMCWWRWLVAWTNSTQDSRPTTNQHNQFIPLASPISYLRLLLLFQPTNFSRLTLFPLSRHDIRLYQNRHLLTAVELEERW